MSTAEKATVAIAAVALTGTLFGLGFALGYSHGKDDGFREAARLLGPSQITGCSDFPFPRFTSNYRIDLPPCHPQITQPLSPWRP